MSGQKRAACSDEVPPAKKPKVSVKMVQKWITESDRETSMSAWLQYEKADRNYVVALKVLYVRASSYKDHAATDMYKRSMLLSKKQRCH